MYLQERFKAQQAPLILRELLSCPESTPSNDSDPVYRLVFNSNSPALSYKVGDSLGVLPRNSREVSEDILYFLGYSSVSLVNSKKDQKKIPVQEFLRSYVDLNKIPEKLNSFFPNKDPSITLYDAIQEYRPCIPIELFVESLFPLLPRFYSIASSPNVYPNRIELLVKHVSYPGKYQKRFGVCSSFLCHQLQIQDSAPIFVQPTRHFTLSKATQGKPLVMIGAGTGIAPYKAFLEERLFNKDQGSNLLFFGERKENVNFYYREFWSSAEEKGQLKLFLAFSREGDQKIYVQDLLRREKDSVRKAYEEGASFFVCGRKVLGTEVKHALEDILGKDALTSLREQHRYVIDVY
ncbi:Sulfite reductase [NADPH] flavoprotein alpha-component,sulfite reductase,Nitric oxide synthase, oxygenase domain,sulfite reductase [NADPH] flavoprotein, alpha-component,FAD binding domain [Chlamydia serpentis]|uniref:Sulfite reductase [NADPH] flavoprotein alpha-component,sulfite reductase,Nitric oxide synthase, oxygenase domain,sulfite reductase [NADPH] flavoprotein, alpha-component,FAD binding domain n=1 Tax=Chlamydia serpentis TaxID=1967782 RepID=A0A2R8FBN8_9CHLA|nr:sulfite reductase flavoprotein subunit alpha [Chlamydia serpentis]SPN73667.1 Sulfite reductase [NADPH] flavoprotein alpha-component,sulfite reductase,Nitric oxide synthase, oxygenase domain,sulfite reductase [NADPH] flavoprotein, alpha-component,FAD binding domain [Chlamydia serpentis]